MGGAFRLRVVRPRPPRQAKYGAVAAGREGPGPDRCTAGAAGRDERCNDRPPARRLKVHRRRMIRLRVCGKAERFMPRPRPRHENIAALKAPRRRNALCHEPVAVTGQIHVQRNHPAMQGGFSRKASSFFRAAAPEEVKAPRRRKASSARAAAGSEAMTCGGRKTIGFKRTLFGAPRLWRSMPRWNTIPTS